MADPKEAAANAPSITEEFKNSVDNVVSTMRTIFMVTGALGVPDLVAALLKSFIPGKPDPVAQALQVITEKLDGMLHFAAAQSQKELMFQVRDVMKDAVFNWRTLCETGFDFGNPKVSIADCEKNTQAANELLQTGTYWLRPFYQAGVYHDPGDSDHWTEAQPALDHSLGEDLPQVWDYRVTMPAFLFAIHIRCAFKLALRTARPDVETGRQFQIFKDTEARPMLTFLSQAYDRMVSGLVTPALPNFTEPEFLRWQKAGLPNGVVDIYSGIGIIGQFFDQGFIFTDLEYDVFAARFNLNNLAKKKVWYRQAGFGAIWSAVQSLRVFVGEVPESIDRNGGLWIREVRAALGSVFASNSPEPAHMLSLESLIVRLTKVGRTGVEPQPVLRPMSLRGSLADATDQQDFVAH
jgi:hypothetical protein